LDKLVEEELHFDQCGEEKFRLYRPNYDIWDKIMRKSLPDKGLRWFLADKNESLAEIVVQQGFQNK
jgi:hypothetical protein